MDTVLIIDDEPQIRRVVRGALADDVAEVIEASTGKEGLQLSASARPTVVVLDLGLPDSQGIDICRKLRSMSQAPILVLSARHSDQEKVALLDAGADDYVTKPFSTSEFQARVRALLRRAAASTQPAAAVVRAGDVEIDLAKPSATRRGERVHLTKTEWDLLRVLMRRGGRTLTHRQLYSSVWKNAEGDAQQNLRVHIRSLRRKLEKDPVRPQLIVTEPGVGYRFETAE